MGIRAKGVSGIKTLASVRSSGTHSNERHVHQFQIASLELERTRRTQERQATLNRLKTLDDRLAGIDEEIRRHQEALGQQVSQQETRKAGPDAVAGAEAEAGLKAAGSKKRHTMRY